MNRWYFAFYLFLTITYLNAVDNLAFIPVNDQRLCEEAQPILQEEILSQSTQSLIDAMLKLAGYCANPKRYRSTEALMGLAAPQVGQMKQIILINTTSPDELQQGAKPQFDIWINPHIISESEKTQRCHEGCYSVPSCYVGIVDRPVKISIEGFDRLGNKMTKEYTKNLASVVHHEIDHLKGIRFPERLHSEKEIDVIYTLEEVLSYRKEWRRWKNKASLDQWKQMKAKDYSGAK